MLAARKFGLGKEDRDYLREYARLRDLLGDRVMSVAKRYQVGAYIVGRAGTGKTHGVMRALEGQSSPYLYRNSRMSCMGLYRTLDEHRDHTIVLDDLPSMYADQDSIQILLAALGGRPGEPRPVTYSIRDTQRTLSFSGGLIAISNVPLRRDRMADALASRMITLEFEPSEDMIRAFVKSEAIRGYAELTPGECMQVAEYVIQECRQAEYSLDLRYYYKGLQDFRQAARGDSTHCWQDLVKSSIVRVSVAGARPAAGRATRAAEERELARGLFEAHPADRKARAEEWMRLTGLSEKMLYRRRSEAVG